MLPAGTPPPLSGLSLAIYATRNDFSTVAAAQTQTRALMAAPVRILLTPASEEVVVHHVPCRIRYDGPAKVSTYFTPARAASGPSVAHFRGRELAGHACPLPPGVSGVVFRELVGAELAVALAGGGGCAGVPPPPPPPPQQQQQPPPPPQLTAAQRLALLDEEEDEGEGGGGFDGGFFGEDMDGSGSEAGSGGGGGSKAGAPAASAAAGAAATASTATRVWAVDGRFSALTSWVHDVPATEHDLLPRALAWMRTAQELHAE